MITPKVRKPELSVLYVARHLVLIYQVSSKYSKGYSSYRADKKFYADADADANGIRPKNNMSPPPFGMGGHNIHVHIPMQDLLPGKLQWNYSVQVVRVIITVLYRNQASVSEQEYFLCVRGRSY